MKVLKIFLAICIALSCIGIVIGPVFLYRSFAYLDEFNDFKKNGTETQALVTNIYDNNNERYTSYAVDVSYEVMTKNGESKEQLAEDVWIYFKAMEAINIGDEVQIYYKNDNTEEVILAINYKPEFIPLNRKEWWGWTLSLVSLGFLLLIPVQKRIDK